VAYARSDESLSGSLLNLAGKGRVPDWWGLGIMSPFRENQKALLGCYVNLIKRVTARWGAASIFAEAASLTAEHTPSSTFFYIEVSSLTAHFD